MLFLYRSLLLLLSPFLPAYLRKRATRGKEDISRMKERLGYPSLSRPQGPLLWLHAASLGEAASVLPLIHTYLERYPQLHILLTTGTVTSAKLAAARLPERAMHQFVPVDTPMATTRFIRYWQPDAALWVESEFWPNLLLAAHKHKARMAVINARMSEESYHRWQRFRSLITPLLHCFAAFYAGSQEDAARLINLGAKNVQFLGNLKFDAPPLPADPKAMHELTRMIAGRPVWLAASTHPGEETIAANVHRQLQAQHGGLLTIIVPRHPPRGAEAAAGLRQMGLRVSMRSAHEEITPQTDIYLADTVGELGLFYRLAGVVFIGGSLVKHGGQNPLEPARLDCVVICGPHMENFNAITHELESEGGCLRVRDGAQLAALVEDLLTHHDKQEALAQAALAVMKEKAGVVDALINALAPLFALPDNNAYEQNSVTRALSE